MSLIDKLEDLVVKVDTEYQEKMEAAIGAHDAARTGEGRGIIPGMVQGGGGVSRHAGAGATSFLLVVLLSWRV